jgi:ubiquinone/menaquinone biosynthesis C-methylase UbiE
MPSVVDRLAYTATQAARVAWFAGHYMMARQMSGSLARESRRFEPEARWPTSEDIRRSMTELFETDWRDISRGIYRTPREHRAARLLALSPKFLRDVAQVDRRRVAGAHSEVLTEDLQGRYPRYYLQNFHYQTDGWLSEHSAKLYDFQVETLFSGTADAMRRRALPPIAKALAHHDQRKLKLLDVAAGTGRFLSEIKHNWPRLPVIALDLSADYLAEARRNLSPWSAVETIEANAEKMPLPDTSIDVASCIFVFHELPPKVRPRVAAEIARVLKTGGTFVLVDSIQHTDDAKFDALTEMFPAVFHEPYYSSYAKEDLRALFAAVGLELISTELAFLSKVMAFRKR